LPYIPDRRSEGYGLNVDSLKQLLAQHSDLQLVITVDQGIVANEAVKFLKQHGVSVIVSDHHQPAEKLPPADAIVHSTLTSGSGVAWFLSNWLSDALKGQTPSLELPAIGTVTDLLPMLGVNRSLIKFGLPDLQTSSRPGLRALFEVAQVVPDQLSTYHIGFQIGPRINAMGRLDHALDSLRLLCTRSQQLANQLALQLDQTNRQRQAMTEQMVQKAELLASLEHKLIMVADKQFDEGVVGLVASKLVEKYCRPVIIVAEQDQVSKASARSVKGFSIIEVLRTIDDQLTTVGGHTMAAGFSVPTKSLPAVTEQLIRIVNESMPDQLMDPVLEIDCQLSLAAVSSELYQQLGQMEPFGIGNSRPVFASRGLIVEDYRLVGKQKQHLKVLVREPATNQPQWAIGFNMADRFVDAFKQTPSLDIVYTIQENIWQGQTSLQLQLKDLQISTNA
jgi:single-stranded-DNA-specific exonuclease